MSEQTITEDQFKFHLEEYRVLRAEIAFHIKVMYDTFIWATLASGAIAAWLLTNSTTISQLGVFHARAAWCIPLFVSVVACLGFYHYYSIIMNTAQYVGRLERSLGSAELGWENDQRANELHSNARVSIVRFALGWAIIILADLALALFVH